MVGALIGSRCTASGRSAHKLKWLIKNTDFSETSKRKSIVGDNIDMRNTEEAV